MKAWKYDPDGGAVWGMSDECPNFTSCQVFKEPRVTTTTRQRMTTIGRVPDGLAASPVMLDALLAHAADDWRERVMVLPGAVVVGDPDVTTSDNLLYNSEITDADGRPVLDEDGRPVVDRDRLFVQVSGWVDLPWDVWERVEAEAGRVASLAAFAERQR
jgi:hypothetical protein